jgi:apolipoprotein D and lipocalin family protein
MMKMKKRMCWFGALTLAAGAEALVAQENPLDVMARADFERYAGKWFEIARLPNPFEEDCARDVTATYTPRGDGRITVANRCIEKDGSVNEAEGVAKLDPALMEKLKARAKAQGFDVSRLIQTEQTGR